MTERKFSKRTWVKTFLRCFFAVMLPFLGVMGVLSNNVPVFADELETPETVLEAENETETEKKETEKKKAEEEKKKDSEKDKKDGEEKKENKVDGENCFNALGEIGWLVCPSTGKIANAVDWLYEKIEGILQISPIQMKDGEPIYEIWKYFRGITNIVFVIFMLVVIYSQITGLGISNYGLKRVMPKLIVAAVLVNLSFLLCTLLVDASNIIGAGMRGIFTSVEETAMASMHVDTGMSVKMTEVYQTLAGGTALAIGAGAIAFETGAIWMLIPVALGAIIAVATGLITIALRQAVVMILIMISPLAVVAYILPNTEQLFEKWKKLLIRMLVFYPAFSLLFGASSLAGFAIITGSKDGFGVLLGIAVQIFPLFFSWKLMRMSGTILGTINEKIRNVASRPMAGAGAWANSHRELSKQKHLASGNVYTPSRYLTQFLADRKTVREAETSEHSATAKERGLAYGTTLKYYRDKKTGQVDMTRLSREGEESYSTQSRRMTYSRTIARDKNNFNKGFSDKTSDSEYNKRISAFNVRNMNAADKLFAEQARGEKIDYDNAKSRYERFESAMNANQDSIKRVGNGYKSHFNLGDAEQREAYNNAIKRYNDLSSIMGGSAEDIHYFGAAAAASYNTQTKVVSEKYQKYFEMLPPTNDVVTRLNDLTKHKDSSEYIDAIVPGLRVLNARGDTDLVREQLQNLMSDGKLILGTHASQSIASFLMMDVKDNDPTLRRFGKYINLETAAVYNKNERKKTSVDLEEYVIGSYENGIIYDKDGNKKIDYKDSKKDIAKLLEGTSFDGVERTAFANYDEIIKKAYGIGDGNTTAEQFEKYLKRKQEVDKAIGPAFISSSLKYLSGSEQLVSAVDFIMGYKEGKDEFGKKILKNKWDDFDGEFAEELKCFYMRSAFDYLAGQTSTQILGLRSDYRDPMKKHLLDMYLVKDDEMDKFKNYKEIEEGKKFDFRAGWDQDMRDERDSLIEKYNATTDLGERKDLEDEMASAQLRNMMGDKLLQIYESKRSGAANNAKDWLRKMIGLDDPEMIKQRIKRKNAQKKEQKKSEAPKQSSDDAILPNISKVEKYTGKLDKFFHDEGISIERSSREEFMGGMERFVADNFKDDEKFNIDFKSSCGKATTNDAIYKVFLRLLEEYFTDKQ